MKKTGEIYETPHLYVYEAGPYYPLCESGGIKDMIIEDTQDGDNSFE